MNAKFWQNTIKHWRHSIQECFQGKFTISFKHLCVFVKSDMCDIWCCVCVPTRYLALSLNWSDMALFAHYIRTLRVQNFQAKSCIIWLSHTIRKLAWKYCTPEWWIIMITCARQIAHDRFLERNIIYKLNKAPSSEYCNECVFIINNINNYK